MIAVLRWLWFWLFVRPVAYVFLGLNSHHAERLPRQGPAIVVANHNSHIDTLVLTAMFPYRLLARIRPVAARDHFARHKRLYWFMTNVMGVIFLKRRNLRPSDGDPLAECSAALAHGDILIVYPEGTRGVPERLAAFKPGIAHLAERHPTVPVVPVFLRGTGKALPRGEIVPVPLLCDVHVGDALRWHGDRGAFMRTLRSAIAALAQEGQVPAGGVAPAGLPEPAGSAGYGEGVSALRRSNMVSSQRFDTTSWRRM
ncbi:MAG: lysophospholipid acyltransferase family protein [Alphaproteobacteria bacterium]